MNILRSRVKAILSRITLPTDKEPKLKIDTEHYQVQIGGETLVLPRKEFMLLNLLYSHPGRLFSREEIYHEIWGDKVVVGDRTIDVHIRKLRQKIGDNHIITIKGMGYKFSPDASTENEE